MVKVGDRIRLSSGKGPDREGIVSALTGSMVGVRWPSGAETMIIPAPGTLTVLASSGDHAPGRAVGTTSAKKATASKKAAGKKAAGKKAAGKKAAGAKRSSR